MRLWSLCLKHDAASSIKSCTDRKKNKWISRSAGASAESLWATEGCKQGRSWREKIYLCPWWLPVLHSITRYIFSFHPFKRETADVVQIELQMSLCCFLRQMLGFCKVKVFSAVPVFVSETHENRFLLWNQGCDKYVKPSLCKQKHHRSHKARACAWIWIIVTSPY